MNARMLQSETEQDIILHHFSHTNPNTYFLHDKLDGLFLFQIQNLCLNLICTKCFLSIS